MTALFQNGQTLTADMLNAAFASIGGIISVSGTPASTLGYDGQYAIDLPNGLVYGPKAGGIWPAGRTFNSGALSPTALAALNASLNAAASSASAAQLAGAAYEPIYSSAAAGVAAGTGVPNTAHFRIISAYGNGLYDYYRNDAGTPTYLYTTQNANYASGLNGAVGLKNFYSTLVSSLNSRRINIRLVGTSISLGSNTYLYNFVQALIARFGASRSTFTPAASQASTPINGWKTQYFRGPFTVRLKSVAGDGATGITTRVSNMSNFIVGYSTDTDGGSLAVSAVKNMGASVALTPINCNGAKSYGNLATYALDATATYDITVAPPTAGTGYLELFIQDAADQGLFFQDMAYGGSALQDTAGTNLIGGGVGIRPADAGMWPSETVPNPADNVGLMAAFAPTAAILKPDLVLYSGPTNDVGAGAAGFATALTTAVNAVMAAGASMMIGFEPVNAATTSATWLTFLAPYLALQAANPDNVEIADFDAFLSPNRVFNPNFHAPLPAGLGNPHPGNYGYGDPHYTMGAFLAQRHSLPPLLDPANTPTSANATTYPPGPLEPLNAPPESVWPDTSNSAAAPSLKRRIAGIIGGRSLWSCVDKSSPTVLTLAQILACGFVGGGTNFVAATDTLGLPCYSISTAGANVQMYLPVGNFVPGKYYTLMIEIADISFYPVTLPVALQFGSSALMFTVDKGAQAFVVQAAAVRTDYVAPTKIGDRRYYAVTFKYPTAADFAAAATAGVTGISTTHITLTLSTPVAAVAAAVKVRDIFVQYGASATLGYTGLQNRAVQNSASAIVSATEPVVNLTDSLAWNDTSNGAALLKRLLQAGGIYRLASNSNYGLGNSVWRAQGGPAANLLSNFVSAGSTGNAVGATAASGTYGPGTGAPGYLITLDNAGGNGQIDLRSPLNLNLALSTVYTLSFLMQLGMSDGSQGTVASIGVSLFATNTGSGSVLFLGADSQTWAAAAAVAGNLTAGRDNATWYRVSLTFLSYAATPSGGSTANNNLALRVSAPRTKALLTATDFKLDLGASMTFDRCTGLGASGDSTLPGIATR
ncbi:MAG: hypothetical protein ACRYG5_02400 [Janthinobacterium lividum]